MSRYILKDRKPVPCDDILEWGRMFESRDRIVKQSRETGCLVSTVFLGLDHGLGDGPPLLFETMIFGGEHDQYQERCSTWEEAEAMHAKACKLAGIKEDQ